MSDPDNGTLQPKKPDNKEMSMETRLLLSFVLMGVVLFATQYLFKPSAQDKAHDKSAGAKQTEPVAAQQQAEKPLPAAEPSAAPPAGTVAAQRDEPFTIDTDVYKVVFLNRGAVIKSWTLKKYRDGKGNPLEHARRRRAGRHAAALPPALRQHPLQPSKGAHRRSAR